MKPLRSALHSKALTLYWGAEFMLATAVGGDPRSSRPLSPRTVGSHLYRIFPKLGISSRSVLVSTLSTAASLGS